MVRSNIKNITLYDEHMKKAKEMNNFSEFVRCALDNFEDEIKAKMIEKND